MNRVMIDMSNPNTLVSLAYIKNNENPLFVFCNYILYVLLSSPNKSLRADELEARLLEKFGLNMPQQMINNCISILKRKNEVVILPHGQGYSAGKTNFDVKVFDDNMRRLREQEEDILGSITRFVKDKYKVEWTNEIAKEHLSKFLVVEGNGARLFLSDNMQIDDKNINPSWYIGRYILNIQESNDELKREYLEDIVNGLMIYNGIYQTNDYQQNKNQKFKGTVFYLDTKLILRALGYSWEVNVKTANELIELITDKYEGKIGIFQQTYNEVKNALERAGCNYKNKEPILDYELRIYAQLDPAGASLMEEVAASLDDILKKRLNIEQAVDIDWNNKTNQNNLIDEKEIIEYIRDQNNWRQGPVSYDVEIIKQINILRKGDYSIRYGGKSKLPVFVTSNTDLVYTFREYVKQAKEKEPQSQWNIHALPIVSDNMVLFRLWVPHAREYSALPALTLAKFAYAAQNPNNQFFEKLRDTAYSYKDNKNIDLFNLSEIRRMKLEDIIVTKSHGEAEQLTDEMVASSVDELIKMENSSLHTKIDELEGTVSTKGAEIEKRDLRIIELVAKPNVNKIGIWKIIIPVAKYYYLILSVILWGIMEYIMPNLNIYSSMSFSTTVIKFVALFFPIALQIIVTLVDKVLGSDKYSTMFFSIVIKKAWKDYSAKIISQIDEKDLHYKEQIIEYCFMNTPVFEKNKKYFTKD